MVISKLGGYFCLVYLEDSFTVLMFDFQGLKMDKLLAELLIWLTRCG